jgi:hypothetical protein
MMRQPCLDTVALRVLCNLMTVILPLSVKPMQAQTGAAVPGASAATTRSLADLLRDRKHPLHILYVHGIGDDGPTDLDSYYLRRSMCETLHCSKRDGEMVGQLVFADSGPFRAHTPPPAISFLGEKVFPADASGASELWDASAPFLRRFKLAGGGAPIYVDELNWWPLVFALKCRYMVAADAPLVGADTTNLEDCAKDRMPYGTTGHFYSYPFLTKDEAAHLRSLPKRGALLNRKLKGSLMDWGFTDAILSLGPMRQLLLEGLQQLIQLAMQPQAGDPEDIAASQEFIIVTHSLGSYLIFAALDANVNAGGSASDGSYVLSHTSRVYFFANQLRLLEMANLDLSVSSNFTQHMTGWVNARTRFLESSGEKTVAEPPQIIAWNDASDLLTWEVPPICGIVVENHTVRNAFNWFGIAEGPTKAHDYYGLNHKVIQGMLNTNSHAEPKPCPVSAITSASAAR